MIAKDGGAPERGARDDKRGRRLTLSMLADRLGISTATVSLALRDSPLVAEETRKRVRALAEELGYIYNRSAASLRTSRTNIVGLVVHDILNPYFAELVSALETELRAAGKIVLLCNHHDDVTQQRDFLETLLQYSADGVVLCPSFGSKPSDIERLVKAGLPTVLVARDVAGVEGVPVIRGDDRGGIKSATEHLIGEGHRRIAFVGGRTGSAAGTERLAGYREALEAAKIPFDAGLVVTDLVTRVDGRRAAQAVLGMEPRPTAVVCFNDLLALGIMTELRRAGLEPGRDLAITGYDDIDEAAEWAPALTSVWNGQQEVGRRAARALSDLIDGTAPEPLKSLVSTELRVRETSAGPTT
jgi:LacI family transcriptional regulator